MYLLKTCTTAPLDDWFSVRADDLFCFLNEGAAITLLSVSSPHSFGDVYLSIVINQGERKHNTRERMQFLSSCVSFIWCKTDWILTSHSVFPSLTDHQGEIHVHSPLTSYQGVRRRDTQSDERYWTLLFKEQNKSSARTENQSQSRDVRRTKSHWGSAGAEPTLC